MMNKDMLEKIEYLRERANVTYEEAEQLLEQFDGDVMRAIVALEKDGRLFEKGASGDAQSGSAEPWQEDINKAKKKATTFFERANKTRVIIGKKQNGGDAEPVANVSALIAVGVTIFAPYVTLTAAIVGLAMGYKVKVERPDSEK